MAHLVTGYAGKAHIKSSDDGAYNAAFFGSGQYVMESGNDNCFAGSIVDNNTVRILDGEGLMYGRHFRIEPNTYEDMTIETGTTGMNRIDLICMTYEKNTDNETETAYLEVIKGTETNGTAVAPEYTNGNILQGASFNQMPLYKVNVKGVVLSSITKMFATLPNYEKQAEVYYQKHEQLAKEYYQKYEEKIDESVAGLIEIPSKVTAQVETNTAKLEAVNNYGDCVYSKDFTAEYSGMSVNENEYKDIYTFDEDFTSLLDAKGKYIAVITAQNGRTQNIKLTGQSTIEGNLQGIIWYALRRGSYLLNFRHAALMPYTESSLTTDVDIESAITTATTLNGLKISFNPWLFQTNSNGILENVSKNLDISLNLSLRIYQVGYDLESITGGGELPEIDYTELDNKPTINGVVVEGDLTSADLGLSSGSGESGVTSLTDLGVEATAEELNYMTNVTGDVQTQLDNKAESNHSHSGYATTATTDSLAERITTLESGITFVFSDTEPETVAENTIVFVYETETTE